MTYKFVVHTTRGKADSLKKPVKVAFTLMPAESKQPTPICNPIVRWMKEFSVNNEQIFSIEWGSMLGFCTYESKFRNGKRWCDTEIPGSIACTSVPGHVSRLTSPPRAGQLATWTKPVPYSDYVAFRQGSVMAVNGAGQEQNMALLIKNPGSSTHYEAIAGYPLVENGGCCIAPSDLLLQAYIISDLGIQVNSILQFEDLTSPLFASPLSCDALPASSLWRLSQDPTGRVQLKSDSLANLGGEDKVDALQRSVADLKAKLSAVEQSVLRAQEGVESGQKAILDMRDQLAATQRAPVQPPAYGTDQKAPSNPAPNSALETRTDRLEESLSQTQDYLTSVQKFLQITKGQVAGLDHKFPSIESRLEESATQSLGVKQSLDSLDLRVAVVERQSTQMAGTLEQIQESLLSTEDTSITFPSRGPDGFRASPATHIPPLDSLTSLDDGLPVLPSFRRS